MSFIDIDRYGFKKSIDLIVWPLNTFMATSRLREIENKFMVTKG